MGKKKGVEKNFHIFQNNIIEEILAVTTPNKWPNLSLIVKKYDIIAYWKKSIRTIHYNSCSILKEKKKSYEKQNQSTKQKQNVKLSISQLVQTP